MDSDDMGSPDSLTWSSTSSESTITPSTPTGNDPTILGLGQPALPPPSHPFHSLPVTAVDPTSWRARYPRIGQFAMTKRYEIIAATTQGLLYFKRVNDHVSQPWSEGHLIPNTEERNDESVTGLSATWCNKNGEQFLLVFCVSNGVLYIYQHSRQDEASWQQVFQVCLTPNGFLSGTPGFALTEVHHLKRLHLVVPYRSGGFIHACFSDIDAPWGVPWGRFYRSPGDMGIISSLCVAVLRKNTTDDSGSPENTTMIMVCIASGRLHTIEGNFSLTPLAHEGVALTWKPQTPTRIAHPGEVIGNPTLIKEESNNQLDLLVPSAEGGVFHFVRTASTPNEWHMIARVIFPRAVPMASCLAFQSQQMGCRRKFFAVIQSGRRLYAFATYERRTPWVASDLRPILSPGPL